MLFKNRAQAGQLLAKKLNKYKNDPNTCIIALPRGGVVLGYEMAKKLNLVLDLVIPRKIGAPNNQEFAIGAITENGQGYFDEHTIKQLGISKEYITQEINKESLEAQRRLKKYRAQRSAQINLNNKNIILVDDGIATGWTMKAAINFIKQQKPKKITVAVPVSPSDTAQDIKKLATDFICLEIPVFFNAVGSFYESFNQTTDQEVIELMEKSKNFGQMN